MLDADDRRSNARPRIVAGIPDLFFASKLVGTARQRGMRVDLVTTRAALRAGIRERPDLVVADLDASVVDAIGVGRELCSQPRPGRMIAFASHVNAELLEEGRRAGWHVLAKGAFAARIPKILSEIRAAPELPAEP